MSREAHETRTQHRLSNPITFEWIVRLCCTLDTQNVFCSLLTTAESMKYYVTSCPAALNRSAKEWLQSRSSMKIAMLPSTLWGRVKISAFAASNLLQL